MLHRFRRSRCGIPRDIVFCSLSITVSSSRELGLHFRVRIHLSPVQLDRQGDLVEHISSGFVPLRDICTQSPLPVSFLHSHLVPPSAFLALSTGYSSRHFVSLFHLTTASRIHTSGVFPATHPEAPLSASLPSCRFHRSPAPKLPR
jgi:hypothetical protein